MRIIIVGDGKVGYSLAEHLSKEDNDVTIIDKNPEALKKAGETLDVLCIRGNGISTNVLVEAGVKESDLLIAATTSDEMNMLCCLTAKKLGVKHTIARIRDPEYAQELSMLKAEIGLDMVINPEKATAGEIARIIKFPPAMNVEVFAKGRVEMVEIQVGERMPIVGMPLKQIASKISSAILIGAVQRGDEVFIPDGGTVIQENDAIYILGQPSKVYDFCKNIGLHVWKIKNVMIMGGGRIAYYLAKYLNESGIRSKIVEINRARCLELAEMLPNSLIICADGTEESLLRLEDLESMGAFVSVTGRDEDNLIAALLAKQYGVPKVVAKVNRISHFGVIQRMGVDSVVSPKLITTNHILRYVRGMKSAMGNPVNVLYKIIGGQAEALEFIADEHTQFLNKPLQGLDIVKGTLVAAIVRKNAIIIPHGKDVIKAGDSVILLTKDKQFTDLNNLVAPSGMFQ